MSRGFLGRRLDKVRKNPLLMILAGSLWLSGLVSGADESRYDLRPEIAVEGDVIETVSKDIMVIELMKPTGEMTREVTEEGRTERREAVIPKSGADRVFIEELTEVEQKKKVIKGGIVISDTTTTDDVLLNRPLRYTQKGNSWEVSVVDQGNEGGKAIEGKYLGKLAEQQLFTDRVYYPTRQVRIGDSWNIRVEAVKAVIGSLPVTLQGVEFKGYLREVNTVKGDQIARIEIKGQAVGDFETGKKSAPMETMIVITGEIRLSLTYGYEVETQMEVSLRVRPEGNKESIIQAQSKSVSYGKRLEAIRVKF